MRTKNTIYNLITNFFQQLVLVTYGFLIPKVIISTFGSNVNGLVTSITQFLGYIVLLESGFGPILKSALYKPISKNNKKEIENILKTAEHFFRVIACIFLIYIIVLSVLYPYIVNSNFNYYYTFSLIVIIAISTFCEYFFGITYKLYLQADQKNYIISIIQVVTYIINIILILFMVKLNCSIHIVKLFSGIIFAIRPLILQIYIKKNYKINLNNADKNYVIKNKWDGLAQHIASVIHNNTDVTLLTFFATLIDVSIYSVYYMIITGIKKIVIIFSNSVEAGFGDMIAKNELDNLNSKFRIFELLNNTIVTIVFTSTLLLITPFVQVYTKSISDADYIKPLFGYLLVISEYIYMLRLPYINITYAAGHFKETKKGAWVECLLNIVISIILVNRYGLIGIAIGTMVAMLVRMCEFIYHSNKYILKRNIYFSIKNILLVVIETIIICIISKYIPFLSSYNYINWLINAMIIFVISCIVTITINYLIYKSDFIYLFTMIKKIIMRRKSL